VVQKAMSDLLDSAYARGTDALWGMWQWLDRTPRGRNERELDLRPHAQYPH
jgi:predicted dithiol-disulfide oxidoreductase (DUF899 family)